MSLGVLIASACGGDEDQGEFSGDPKADAGADTSFGGAGGSTGGGDPNCTSPNCSGCQGCFLICMCQQSNADFCLSQCSGAGGAGGTGGTGGTAGTGGMAGTGGTSGGSCNPSFCPNPGFGSPCCVTPNGPCGADMGMGCMPNSGGGG